MPLDISCESSFRTASQLVLHQLSVDGNVTSQGLWLAGLEGCMPKSKRLKTILWIMVSFLVIAAMTIYLARAQVITIQQMGLMIVASAGLYVGIGVLVSVYRLIGKLD